MTAPESILRLIERFDSSRSQLVSSSYNETQIRREFIDPFFTALGWDIDNRQGAAEAYKDVIHEDAIRIGTATKAPDYAFRIGGARKFFVEAKKPAVNIKEDVGPAFQLRRYAWSAKLPVSILTDFDELAVYDCRIKPIKTDKSSTARIKYLTYKDYIPHWEEIHSVFSKDAVWKGSFDKYVVGTKGKKGADEVDDAFLKEIEAWRDVLARNIALRNPKLTVRELNFAVQRTIDRIIFLRICEDRGIETYGGLQALANGDRIYKRLGELFQRADEKYNSGLFHFAEEKDRPESPDSFTLNLKIDDKPLKEILAGLYYPDCPYEFSILPADILGQVYEQFLGKVIRLTAGHQAKVEEKPEVKKAGGVYYTPTFIVDYIVKNTVGKLVEEKTPKQVAVLRVLDPACGSGSFLIGAYQYLLDWHHTWYTKDSTEKWSTGKNATLYSGPGGVWRLTTAERKRILLNSIYGVDIDSQAVEVTKLSLLLKVLEGENEETINQQLKMFHERALPDLGSNIKCGNSLIGSDFFEGQLIVDLEERSRINVFDWEVEFKEIMDRGGFDAVIGNPPYVDIKGLQATDVDYIFSAYSSANNRINLFAAFIEKMLSVVQSNQFRFSFIVPTALLTQDSYMALRDVVLNRTHICSLVRLPNESFGRSAGNVKVDTVIFVLAMKAKNDNMVEVIAYEGYDRITTIDANVARIHGEADQSRWAAAKDHIWSLGSSNIEEAILAKCEMDSVPLEECADISLGLTPYDKYRGHSEKQIRDRVFHSDHKKDHSFKRLLAGNDVLRYEVNWNGTDWISYGPWLGAPREQRFFCEKHILVKQIIDWSSKRIWATLTEEELYNTQNAFNLLPKGAQQLEFLLGILNSRLMTFYHRKKYLDEYKMRFQKILIKDARRFPIPMGRTDAKEQRVDEIALLVVTMLHLHKDIASVKTDHERTALQRQIDTTNKQIDALVYELYGLTEEEIRIVET